MPDVFVDGLRLDCRPVIPAPPGQPTIVFLHEGLGCHAQWRDLPERLAAATGFGACAFSRWGYARSDPRPRPWPMAFLDDEAHRMLPAVLDALGLERVLLYGHSDGGTIALAFAAAHPARVAGLITEAAHVMVEACTLEGLRSLRERWASGGLREALERYHGARADDVFHGWSDVWLAPAFRNWDIRATLAGVSCPVLAIQGSADEYGTPRQLDDIAAGVSGPVHTWLIPGCGHAPHRERPAEVFARAAAFLAEAASAGRNAQGLAPGSGHGRRAGMSRAR
jgi:pimeloyl-ACP methyl ester carboxylesterase